MAPSAGTVGERYRCVDFPTDRQYAMRRPAETPELILGAALAAADATPHDGGEEPAKADLRACAAAHLHRVLRAADPVARRVAERSPWVPKLDKRPD